MHDVLVFLYVPFPTHESAAFLANKLVEERKVVCVNIFAQGQSFYHWEGNVANDAEVYALFKVLPSNVETVVGCIQSEHPYDVPAILSWNVQMLTKEYAEWAQGQN